MGEAEIRAQQAKVERDKANAIQEQSNKKAEKRQKEAEKSQKERERSNKEAEKQTTENNLDEKKGEKADLEANQAEKLAEKAVKEEEIAEHNQTLSVNKTAASTGQKMQAEMEANAAEFKKVGFIQDDDRIDRMNSTLQELDQAEIDLQTVQDDTTIIQHQVRGITLDRSVGETTQGMVNSYDPGKVRRQQSEEEKEFHRQQGIEKAADAEAEMIANFNAIHSEVVGQRQADAQEFGLLVDNFNDEYDRLTAELEALREDPGDMNTQQLEYLLTSKTSQLRRLGRDRFEGLKIIRANNLMDYYYRLREVEEAFYEALQKASLDPVKNFIPFVKICNEYRAVLRDDCILLQSDSGLLPVEVKNELDKYMNRMVEMELKFTENPMRHFMEYCFALENYIEFAKDYCIGDKPDKRAERHERTKKFRIDFYEKLRNVYYKTINDCEASIGNLHKSINDMEKNTQEVMRAAGTMTEIQGSSQLSALSGHMDTLNSASGAMGHASEYAQDGLAVEQMTDVYKINALRVKLKPYQVTIADAKNKGEDINFQVKRFVAAAAEIGETFLEVVEQAKEAGIYDEDIHNRIQEVLELNKILIIQLFSKESEDRYDENGSGPSPTCLSDVIVKNMWAYHNNKTFRRNFKEDMREGFTGELETFTTKMGPGDENVEKHSRDHLIRLKNMFGGMDDIYYNRHIGAGKHENSNGNNETVVEHFGSEVIRSKQRYEKVFGEMQYYGPEITDRRMAQSLGNPTRFNPLGLRLTNSELEAYSYTVNILGDYEERVRYKGQNTIDYLLRAIEILSDIFEKKQKLKHQAYEVVLQGSIRQLEETRHTEQETDDLDIRIGRMTKRKLEHQNLLFKLNTSISSSIRSLLSNLRVRVKSLKSVMHVYLEVAYGNNSDAVKAEMQEISLPPAAELAAIEESYKGKLNEVGMRAERDKKIKALPKTPIRISQSSYDEENDRTSYILDKAYKLKRIDNGGMVLRINCDTSGKCLPVAVVDGSKTICEPIRLPHVIKVDVDFIRRYPVQTAQNTIVQREDLVMTYQANVITDMESDAYTINLDFTDMSQVQTVKTNENNISALVEQSLEVSQNMIARATDNIGMTTQFVSNNKDNVNAIGNRISGVIKKTEGLNDDLTSRVAQINQTISTRARNKSLVASKIARIEEILTFIKEDRIHSLSSSGVVDESTAAVPTE